MNRLGEEYITSGGNSSSDGVMVRQTSGDFAFTRIKVIASDGEYSVLHRVASSGRRRGVLQEAVSFAFAACPHIRIDTHALNAPMQSALMKLGFRRCGITEFPCRNRWRFSASGISKRPVCSGPLWHPLILIIRKMPILLLICSQPQNLRI